MIVNLNNLEIQNELEKRISSEIQRQMVGFSSVTDKGREFTGVDFSHFVHWEVPTIVRNVIIDVIKGVK